MLDLFKEGGGAAHLRGPVDPYQLAEALGVPVLYTRRLTGSLGVTDGKRVWLRRGMTRAALAEALGVDVRMARTAVELLCHRSPTGRAAD